MASTMQAPVRPDEPLARAKQSGTEALEKAKEAVECVGAMAGHTMSAVGKKVDDLTAAAGHELKAAGDAIEQKAPHDGLKGHASHAVAGTLQGGGTYVEQAKLSGMAHDLTEVVKKHPVPSLLICLGLGYCAGRAMSGAPATSPQQ